MLAIFGLGNPGSRYEGTRHNVGFEVVDKLAQMHGDEIKRRKFNALVGELKIADERSLIVKPQTFMNESGRSVAAAALWHDLEPHQILVICDDLDLESGVVRVKRGGSSGGHNGLKSIIAALGTEEFPRIRVGIGRPEHGDSIDYVLGRVHTSQRDVIDEAVSKAAEAAACWVSRGIDACMNRFN